ncbi:MAG: NUDIX hydrolase, partial [Chloroflexi bacterium]|nr:NUDIX hydrolase [Chloroflexota bacterium]
MELWKTIQRRTILDHSKFLQIEEHVVQLPNGRIINNWPWVVTPDFINVVAVTEDGRFPIFRQTKYSIQGISLAPVGGYLEPGEEPLAAAQRELREETGYVASEWHPLGQFPVDGNRGAGTAHFFLAQQAQFAVPIDADDLEEQQLLLMSREAIDAALAANEFKLLPWVAIVTMALRQLDANYV